MYLIKGNKMRGCDRNGISIYFNYFIPYFFYLEWKDKPKQKNKSFCYLYKFYMIYLWFILIISIMAIGIFSLGVLAVRGEKLTSGFFVLSFLGIVLFSFYIFSILKEIKELKQIKGM